MNKDEAPVGCKFCTDDEFARRHVMEDDALVEVATVATHLLNEYKLSGARLVSPDTWLSLERVLFRFRNLDSEEQEVKRTIKALQKVQEDLET